MTPLLPRVEERSQVTFSEMRHWLIKWIIVVHSGNHKVSAKKGCYITRYYKYGGVNSPQAWQEGQVVTRAGSSPQVDPSTGPTWQGGGGENPGM